MVFSSLLNSCVDSVVWCNRAAGAASGERHHGRRPTVLLAMEQSPIDAGVSVRHSAGEGNSRGLHSGRGGPDSQGSQSSPVGLQSLFRGWYLYLCVFPQSRSIAIVYKLLTRHSCALINIPVVSF